MLQMNCSNCGELIKSPRLAEVQLFLCPHCEGIVLVENVAVSTPKTSINFLSSLKNLLLSARDKFQLNKSNKFDLQTKYDIDKRLAKLLRRDDFRLNMSHDFFVQINFDNNKRTAKLLNISSTGASIEFFELGLLPENDSETKFHLLFPEQAEPLSLLAKVVWIGKPAEGTISPTITMGLQFKDIDEKIRSYLWDFIVRAETSVHT
jgi:hypothetical protein